MPVKEEEHHIR